MSQEVRCRKCSSPVPFVTVRGADHGFCAVCGWRYSKYPDHSDQDDSECDPELHRWEDEGGR